MAKNDGVSFAVTEINNDPKHPELKRIIIQCGDVFCDNTVYKDVERIPTQDQIETVERLWTAWFRQWVASLQIPREMLENSGENPEKPG